MIENLPVYISLIFALTTLLTLFLFYRAVRKSTFAKKAVTVLVCLTIWLILQAALTLNGVYSDDTTSIPPKIVLFGVLPAILTIILLFITRNGRQLVDALPLWDITFLNIVRIPVELILFWLFLNKAVPQLMTFEGRNFDIIAGITAPLVAYFGITKKAFGRNVILVWNFICLALLFNIVINALLSAPSPMQKFGFDQPNIAIFYFPFSWLPTFIVPVVLLTHLASIRQLMKSR